MDFDPDNHIVKLCAQGMNMEGEGKPEEASCLFHQAWNEATNDFEKYTAAHYVARDQKSAWDKLKWDTTALELALNINNDIVKETLPSLYLNVAICYEDVNDLSNAKRNYALAHSFADFLPDNGYGHMVNYQTTKDGLASYFIATCLLLRRVRSLTVAPYVYSQVPYEVF